MQLNGSGSTDPDGDPLTFRWTLVTKPAGSTATLTGPTTVTPTFVPDVAGTYSVQLIVNDGKVDSAPTTVTITATMNHPPVANAGPDQTVTVGATVTLDGSGSSDPDGNPITYQWTLSSKPAGSTATLANATTVSPSFVADVAGMYVVQLIVNDGIVNSVADTVTITAGSGGGLPPDPATVAPPVDRSVATDLATATAFLYTGNNPIQTGVVPGTIEARRAAVLRGKVLTRDGQPLSGVTITILHHAEFGQTLSRADGMFDLVVNGGGQLTLNYHKVGFLSAQRQLTVPWQDYAWLPDVVLISVDPQVTTVDLVAATPIQVARGSVQSDTDGTRQATLLFPQGTQAHMVLPDGSTQPLSTLSVRATEFTVGPTGPQAMPAALPPASAYTYAVEFTADEAEALGATAVRFSQPVIAYVENFLHSPVGGLVPVGAYDRQAGMWIPSNNGRALQIVSITNGLANLDIDGSGQAASASALGALGITDAERQQLATLYQPGQSLWRMSIPHFTTYDGNFPYECPSCPAPNVQPPTGKKSDCPNTAPGSTIECQNQILGEALDITGTPFSLHYRSDRVPGRKANNTLEIPISGATVSQELTHIELEVLVAGRKFVQSFPSTPNQHTTFTWDGQDAYQRPLQGEQPATVVITYFYRPRYRAPDASGGGTVAIFGLFLDGPAWDPARQEFYVPKAYETTVGTWDARAQGVGGGGASTSTTPTIPRREYCT